MAGVVGYASGQVGRKVGDGECTRLVEAALTQAGMKTTANYGVTGRQADYKWGRVVTIHEAKPGDVIQFRNHTMVVTTRNYDTGKMVKETHSRPHHTAVITSKGVRGGEGSIPRTPTYYSFSILEQNHAGKKWVAKNTVQFERSVVQSANGDEVTTESYGEYWIYRPEPK